MYVMFMAVNLRWALDGFDDISRIVERTMAMTSSVGDVKLFFMVAAKYNTD